MNDNIQSDYDSLGAVTFDQILSAGGLVANIFGGSSSQRADLEAYGQTLKNQIAGLKLEISNLTAQRNSLMAEIQSRGIGLSGLNGFLFFGNKKQDFRNENADLEAERNQLLKLRDQLLKEVANLQSILSGKKSASQVKNYLLLGAAVVGSIILISRYT